MKLLLVLIWYIIHLCTLENLPPRPIHLNITYPMLLKKSAFDCIKSRDLLQPGLHPSDMVKYWDKLDACFGQLWHQCLVMNDPIKQGSSVTFPCSKGITVRPDRAFQFNVESYNSFHFNLTFLKFDLQRYLHGCKIRYLFVSYTQLSNLFWCILYCISSHFF